MNELFDAFADESSPTPKTTTPALKATKRPALPTKSAPSTKKPRGNAKKFATGTAEDKVRCYLPGCRASAPC